MLSLLCVAVCFLAGCSTVDPGPPAFADSPLPELAAPPDPPAMARAAAARANYGSTIEELIPALKLARSAFEKDPSNRDAALSLSKCALFASYMCPDRQTVYRLAREGYRAATLSKQYADDPTLAYYAGVHLGLMLGHEGIKSIARLPELERILKTACNDPETDMGGPLRVLGMLYLRAPAWPRGIGDLDLALENLQKAATQYPAHPANHIFYAEALREDGNDTLAEKHLDRALSVMESGNWGCHSARWSEEIRIQADP